MSKLLEVNGRRRGGNSRILGKNYPQMSKLPLKPPGSSASIESNTVGNAIIGKRNRLADKNLEQEVQQLHSLYDLVALTYC